MSSFILMGFIRIYLDIFKAIIENREFIKGSQGEVTEQKNIWRIEGLYRYRYSVILCRYCPSELIN